MNTYFPQFKAMWMAENIDQHDAQHPDAARRPGARRAEVGGLPQRDHRPLRRRRSRSSSRATTGRSGATPKIIDYWKKQRDLYKYMHDQTVHLMNKGYTGAEIAEMIELPPELDKYWPNRGYYGTLRHNSRAVYQRYMGWYDGNPADLNNLPPEPAAKKYVEYMGGEAAVLKQRQGRLRQGRVPLGRRGAQARRVRQPEQQGRPRTCWPTPTSSSATRPSRARGASCTCRAPIELRNGVPERRRHQHRQPGHDPGDAAGDAVRLPRGASERARRRRARRSAINVDFTDLKQAVRPDRSRTACSTTAEAARRSPMRRSR